MDLRRDRVADGALLTTYAEMAQRLFPRLQKRDGIPEGELKTAEARVKFALPSELRAMYRLAGRRHDIHAAHDRLILPKSLVCVNKALVFYEEHDRAAAWAVRVSDMAKDDPPVVTAKNEPPYTWELDHDALSQFFFTELLWTHVRSEPCAVLAAKPRLDGFEEIPLPGCHWNVDGCFARDGVVVMVRADQVYAGATSEDDLPRS
jgi:hypothetical protein